VAGPSDDDAGGVEPTSAPAATRRREAALAGHDGDPVVARALLADADPGVRATALRALARLAALEADDLAATAADPEPSARRAAAEVAGGVAGARLDPERVGTLLLALLADADATVVEVAAWATGEWCSGAAAGGPGTDEPVVARPPAHDELVDALRTIVRDHDDALCREAAVAALGAIGDERALETILAATADKATVRRRAIIALAPFDGPEVDAALERALTDRDWQVRQAAEDLLAPDPHDPR
jgi:HEAT repeat protein